MVSYSRRLGYVIQFDNRRSKNLVEVTLLEEIIVITPIIGCFILLRLSLDLWQLLLWWLMQTFLHLLLHHFRLCSLRRRFALYMFLLEVGFDHLVCRWRNLFYRFVPDLRIDVEEVHFCERTILVFFWWSTIFFLFFILRIFFRLLLFQCILLSDFLLLLPFSYHTFFDATLSLIFSGAFFFWIPIFLRFLLF